jgi:hypothetical protein
MAEISPFPVRPVVPETAPPHPAPPEFAPLWREAVGDVLRTARHERGDRLSDTARRSGVSPQYLSEMERGLKDPSSEMLAAVAGALDLTLHDLTRAVSERLAPASTGAVLRVA